MSDLILLLRHSQTVNQKFFCLCKTRIVTANHCALINTGNIIARFFSCCFSASEQLMTYVQMSSKHGRWLDGTLFRGRALMHSSSRKNVTAIDRMLRSVVGSTQWRRLFNAMASIGGSQFNEMAIQYGKLSTQRHYSYYPTHFWQFNHAQAKNI